LKKATKLFLALLIISHCTVLTATQQKPTTGLHNHARSGSERSYATWKEFLSKEGKFKILFPVGPKKLSLTQKSVEGTILYTIRYKSLIIYEATWVDYPVEIESPDTRNETLDDVETGGLSALAQKNPRVIKKEEISVDGHPGRFLQVELRDNTVIHMNLIPIKRRLYYLAITTPKPHRNAKGLKINYERIASNYLDSFKPLDL
jgi:hypothetical protein